MKKTAILAAILAATAAFSSCGTIDSSSSSKAEKASSAATEASSEVATEGETEADTTEAAPEATTEAVTEAPEEATEAPAADNDYTEIARYAMISAQTAEMLAATCMEYDAERTLPSDENYALVTNNILNGCTFNTTDDIKNFLAGNFTETAYDHFKYIIDNDIYADGDDGLYVYPAGRGYRYRWVNDEPTIVSSDDTSFVFEAQYALEGGDLTFSDFRVVKKDGTWVISEISDGFPLS